MLKALFWLFVVVDVGGLLLFYLLGLAAAGPSKTNPVWVTFLLFILPGLLLLAAVLLYLRSTSPTLRFVAFGLAASPLVLLVATRALAVAQFRANSNEQGELTFFGAGPKRDIVEAIRRNDSATVATLAPTVAVNDAGMDGMTLLISALRQLRSTPDQHGALRVLLAAGADPNQGTEYEIPLEMALQVAAKSGPAPVKMLLDAGADPNRTNSNGTPIFFGGAGNGMGADMLPLLVAHGADLTRTGRKGERVLFYAADARNWTVVLWLLQQGVDWREGQSSNGKTFEAMLEGNAGWAGNDPGFTDVMAYIKQH